jgi:hypothetical protein
MDLLTVTAEVLLALPPEQVMRSFGRGPAGETQWRRVLHRWHPDRNPDPQASPVFAHLQAARQAWRTRGQPHQVNWSTTDGRRLEFRYLRVTPTAVGAAYQGRAWLADTVALDQADLVAPAQARLRAWRFASPAMASQMKPALPDPARCYTTPTATVLVRPRPPGLIRLTEVRAHFGGALDPRHVAWIGSALWNFACYLQYAQVAHHDLTLDSVWIHPEDHRIAVLDPWLYAADVGAPLRALPARSLELLPRAYIEQRMATGDADPWLIRALLRELLGDPTGMRWPTDVPTPMAAFVRLPAIGSAVAQYAAWKQALVASFGSPRYTRLDLAVTDIDPEE